MTESLNKKRLPRLIALLLAAVMLAGMVANALAQMEWPAKLASFERTNPVWQDTAARGTQ